jgi:hypothetical protein
MDETLVRGSKVGFGVFRNSGGDGGYTPALYGQFASISGRERVTENRLNV